MVYGDGFPEVKHLRKLFFILGELVNEEDLCYNDVMGSEKAISGNSDAQRQPLNEKLQMDQSNIPLDRRQGGGVADVRINNYNAMDPMQRMSNIRMLMQGLETEDEVNTAYPSLGVFNTDRNLTEANKQIVLPKRMIRLERLQKTHAHEQGRLGRGMHAVVNKENGEVENVIDAEKREKHMQHVQKYGGVMKYYQNTFDAFHGVEDKVGHEKRLQALARGETVEIHLGERRETIGITFPDGFTHEEKVSVLRAMWEQRGLLVKAYDTQKLIILQDPRFVDEYEDILVQFNAEDPRDAVVRMDQLAQRASSSNEFRNLAAAQAVVQQQVIIFGRGVSIPLREATKLRGEGVSGTEEILRIHENLVQLNEQQRKILADCVQKGWLAIVLTMLSGPPLKTVGNSAVMGVIEGLKVFVDSQKAFVKAKHTNRTIRIRDTIPPETGFDFVRAESLEDGKAAVLTQWSNETHRRLLALLGHIDVTDHQYTTERAAKHFEHILDVIFKGCSSIAEQRERMEALGLTSGGMFSYPRATLLGIYFGYIEGTGSIDVLTYKDLLAVTHQWDTKGKFSLSSASDILAERADSNEHVI